MNSKIVLFQYSYFVKQIAGQTVTEWDKTRQQENDDLSFNPHLLRWGQCSSCTSPSLPKVRDLCLFLDVFACNYRQCVVQLNCHSRRGHICAGPPSSLRPLPDGPGRCLQWLLPLVEVEFLPPNKTKSPNVPLLHIISLNSYFLSVCSVDLNVLSAERSHEFHVNSYVLLWSRHLFPRLEPRFLCSCIAELDTITQLIESLLHLVSTLHRSFQFEMILLKICQNSARACGIVHVRLPDSSGLIKELACQSPAAPLCLTPT